MEDVFEPVLEVTEYLDGPSKGIALLHGKPHTFRSRTPRATEYRGDFESVHLFDLVPVGAPINAIPVLAYAQFRESSLPSVQVFGASRRLEVCWRVFVQVSA